MWLRMADGSRVAQDHLTTNTWVSSTGRPRYSKMPKALGTVAAANIHTTTNPGT